MSDPSQSSSETTTRTQGAGGGPGRGAWWVVGQLVLMGAVGMTGWLLPGRWPSPWGGLAQWLSGALLLAGAGVGIAGAVSLRGGRTIFPEPPPNAVLVDSGIFRHIRHPLYLSVILLSLAWATWRLSGWCLATSAVLAWFLAAKAAGEERRLCRCFPGSYADYQSKTARFLPGLW